ncbi:UBX domain-containing protein 10 isoform X2 [Electrophorus electricus]|uniref:UBX domain-containing protein 10 isoform X2 n=1 Tax=Electrophorus electricus TaxID=8005 RepID=UPI0015D00FC3|nr:UBX domain-containing protein 10 isoform X2 [Electrophorus electricus]
MSGNMHVTRPKSSKGRTRSGSHVQNVDESVCQNCAFSPHPPPSDRLNTTARSRPVLHRNSKPSTDILTEIFQSPPDIPPDVPALSLNKYKVLPSIEKRPAGNLSARDTEDETPKPSLSDSNLRLWREQLISSRLCPQTANAGYPEMDGPEVLCGPVAANPLWVIPGHAGAEGGVAGKRDTDLLLAVRIPCGQRFKCLFHPTDMLYAVVAAAEAKSGLHYEHAVIETMEVPRRTFKDLTMTLSQCGIFSKSVLCISLEDSTTNNW